MIQRNFVSRWSKSELMGKQIFYRSIATKEKDESGREHDDSPMVTKKRPEMA